MPYGQQTNTVFTPSAQAVANLPAGGAASSFALPPPDPANTALVVVNQTGGPIWFQLGMTSNIRSGPDVPCCTRVEANSTILLQANAFNAVATNVGVSGSIGNVVFLRGSANQQWVFPNN